MDIQKSKNLTAEQQFRYELWQRCASTQEAQRAYKFITEPDSKETVRQAQPSPEKSTMRDGIYFIDENGVAVLSENRYAVGQNRRIPKEAIGLKMGAFAIKIALKDEWLGRTTNLITMDKDSSDKDENYDDYIVNYDDAVADMRGKDNTDRLRPILNPEIKLADGWYIPSLGELYRIFLNKAAINGALQYIPSAQKLQGKWYWASTQYSAKFAWGMRFVNGGCDWYNNFTDVGAVRAVAAWEI